MIKIKTKMFIAVGLLVVFSAGLVFVEWRPSGDINIGSLSVVDANGYSAENIVYDSSMGRYWWVIIDRNAMGIRMVSSSDFVHWDIEKELLIGDPLVDSACIRRFGGIWYLFYSRHFDDGRSQIWMCSSSKVNEGFSSSQLVLEKGALDSWDANRVSEPDLVWKDGKYYLFYMGEDSKNYEKIGYAISNSPSGPFVKYSNNPVLSGSSLYELKWNSGHSRATNPDVFQIDEGYIIQNTACKISKDNWSIGWSFTKDFISFRTMIVPVLTTSSWSGAVSGGGIIKVKGKYYMSFTRSDGEIMRCELAEINNFEELKNKIVL